MLTSVYLWSIYNFYSNSMFLNHIIFIYYSCAFKDWSHTIKIFHFAKFYKVNLYTSINITYSHHSVWLNYCMVIKFHFLHILHHLKNSVLTLPHFGNISNMNFLIFGSCLFSKLKKIMNLSILFHYMYIFKYLCLTISIKLILN